MRAIGVLLLALLLAGCTRQLTEAQAVQLAQGKANVEASRATADAGARSKLLQAAASRLMAGLSDLDLPAAPHPAQSLVNKTGDPLPLIETEEQESMAAENDPPSGFWAVMAAGAGGVGLLALSVLRFSPGAFGVIADLGHTLLAPRATREMRAVQVQATQIAQQAVAYGHAVTQAAEAAGLKPTVESIKDQFGRAQEDLGIRDQIDTLLQTFKGSKQTGNPT